MLQGLVAECFANIIVFNDKIKIRKMYRSHRPARLTYTMLKRSLI